MTSAPQISLHRTTTEVEVCTNSGEHSAWTDFHFKDGDGKEVLEVTVFHNPDVPIKITLPVSLEDD